MIIPWTLSPAVLLLLSKQTKAAEQSGQLLLWQMIKGSNFGFDSDGLKFTWLSFKLQVYYDTIFQFLKPC